MNHDMSKGEREKPNKRQTKQTTKQTNDKPNKRQTKQTTNQTNDKPNKRQTKQTTNQTNDKPKISWKKAILTRYQKLEIRRYDEVEQVGNDQYPPLNVYQVQNNNNLNTKYNQNVSTLDTNLTPKKKVVTFTYCKLPKHPG